MSKTLNTVLHAAQSVLMVAGIVVMVVRHKMPVDTAAGLLAGLGGVWSGVAGSLVTLGRTAAATAPKATTVGAGASPAPSPTLARVEQDAEHVATDVATGATDVADALTSTGQGGGVKTDK